MPQLISLGIHNLDVRPIKTKADQLDNYVGWVYTCVSKIAQDVRSNPRGFWVKKGKRREDWEPLDPARVPRMFTRPNSRQTWGQLLETRSQHKDITGESYWHLLTAKPGGVITGAEMIQPDWVECPIYSEDGRTLTHWKVVVPGRAGGVKEIDAVDIIPDFYPNPKDPTRGMSPLEAFALAHHLDIYLRAYGLKMIRDGASAGQFLKTEQELTDDQVNIAEKRLTDKFRTPGRIPVFGKGTELKYVGLPLRDLDMLRMLQPSQNQILATYGMPKSKLGLMEGEGRANNMAADKTYQENSVLPRLRTGDEIINEYIVPRVFAPALAKTIVYESESPVEVDREFELKKAEAIFKDGASTINTFLRSVGLQPIGPDGDVYFIPQGVRIVRTMEDAIEITAEENDDAEPNNGRPKENLPESEENVQKLLSGPAAQIVSAFNNATSQKTLAARQEAFITNVQNIVRETVNSPLQEVTNRLKELETAEPAIIVQRSEDDVIVIDVLRRENASLRFLATEEEIERTAKSQIRSLFSKEQKLVVEDLERNMRGATPLEWALWCTRKFEGVETRDWLDESLKQTTEAWNQLIKETMQKAIRAGWALLSNEVAGALSFSVFQIQAVEFAARESAKKVVGIQAVTVEQIRETIRKGIESGASIEKIAKSIAELYDGFRGVRAETIARTETANAVNYGKHQNAIQTARRLNMKIRRTWITTLDERTRDTHVGANGQTIGMEALYLVGTSRMKHPGDPAAPASEVINCRCTEVFEDTEL